MLVNITKISKNIRVYAQLIASIIMSSYFGLIAYFSTIFFSKKNSLRVNNIFVGLIIFSLIIVLVFPLMVQNSTSSISYLKTLLLWMLPIIYYSVSFSDLDNKFYERLLIIMLIYCAIEFMLINFTSISFFESDRSRSAQVFNYVRSEGVTHNSSISSALVVSIFLKIFLEKGFSLKFFVVTFISIILLGSGAGMLLFVFAFLFFILKKKILFLLLFISLIFVYWFIQQPGGLENLQNIHPKISYKYISYLIQLKTGQISAIFLNSDSLLLGISVLDGSSLTSGDFGYLIMIAAIGLIPSLLILFGVMIMFIRASHIGNFAPFLILMIETLHYPVFVDPISAYILAQYAIRTKRE